MRITFLCNFWLQSWVAFRISHFWSIQLTVNLSFSFSTITTTRAWFPTRVGPWRTRLNITGFLWQWFKLATMLVFYTLIIEGARDCSEDKKLHSNHASATYLMWTPESQLREHGLHSPTVHVGFWVVSSIVEIWFWIESPTSFELASFFLRLARTLIPTTVKTPAPTKIPNQISNALWRDKWSFNLKNLWKSLNFLHYVT